MKITNIEFPNPVLAENRDDYIDSHFAIQIDESNIPVIDDNFVINTKITLDCNGLNQLISEYKASVIIVVKSSSLSYRRVFTVPSNRDFMDIRINKNSVADRIELTGYIVASENIAAFSLPEHNPDYFKGVTFSIRKGDILAQDSDIVIKLDDSELDKPLSSIFNLCRVENLPEMIIPDFDGDKIEVQMNVDLYDTYYGLRSFNNGSFRRYLAGTIIFPVLVEAIDKIIGALQSDPEGEDLHMIDKRWYLAIDKEAKKMSIDLREYNDSSVTLANNLLGDVVKDALVSFKSTIEEEMSGEDIALMGGND